MEPLNTKQNLTEKQLLERLGVQDAWAFDVLYDRFRPKVYTYALRISRSIEVAEDIVHEVFLRLWQSNEPERIESVEAYLRVITRNLTLKWLRRTILERTISAAIKDDRTATDLSTEQWINLRDTQEVIDRAIELLPPQRRLIFHLCKNEGLKYKEVAERTNLSQLTVKTHMQLALRFLRDYMAKYHDLVVLLLVILLQQM
ncbi:RNA polymerase sigma-70 factor [Parapedobacter pyrenivorans]|uniref:RNA polymerase sigma-70 factor n=1 Tax=Parapedobacter pyrenivorans TaxID=1305674 RepID=UPI00334253CD